MERLRWSWTVLLGAGCLAAGYAAGHWVGRTPPWRGAPVISAPSAPGGPSFADVVQRAGPGVVTVRAEMRAAFTASDPDAAEVAAGGDPPASAAEAAPVLAQERGFRSGSGFVIHERGLVVTSHHVVQGAESIGVLVPRRGAFRGELVGTDAAADLALVRLIAPPADLPALPIGVSEELRAGDWIVAVGNPVGFAQTVTAGVVSFVGRHLSHSDFGVTSDFLQFSAQVNPGSSGCPVLDLRGNVVGVTTQAARAAQGISFAVPSRTLKWALAAMERSRDGRVRRGYLGIEFASREGLDDSGQPNEGALITRVAEGEPAERAGVRPGDVVLRVDGRRVADPGVLHERIVCGEPGSRVALTLLREGRVQDPIEAVLGEVGRRTHLTN